MSCEVCIGNSDYDFDGTPEFYSTTEPKARKEHKCGECAGVITRGTRYNRFSGKYDGVIFTEKKCLMCAEVAAVFSCGETHPEPGNLWDTMEELAFPRLTTASECFQELSPEAKAFVLDRWRKWKGLT